MRHGCSDPIFAETDGCRDIRRRNRLRKRGVSACALSRIYTPPYGGRFPENGFADAVSRRTACDRQFPYNILSQIFFKVLENRDLIPECVGMIQKEVAVRLAEPPGSKEYGILSVLLQAWYDIEYLFTVNETVFNPPPKVKSAVVRLRRNGVDRLDCDERLFVRVVKASFGQRRRCCATPAGGFRRFRRGGTSLLHAACRAAFGRRFRRTDTVGGCERNIVLIKRIRPDFRAVCVLWKKVVSR